MDSHQLFGYSSSSPNVPSRVLSSLNHNVGNFPNSSLLSRIDSDSITNLSDSQEQSSTENLSGVSLSCNSSIDTNSYFLPISDSPDYCQGIPLLYLGAPEFSRDVSSTRNISHTLQELETALMAPNEEEDEISKPNSSFGESSRSQNLGQPSMLWSKECHDSHYILSQPSFTSRRRHTDEAVRIEKRQKSMEEDSLQGFPSGNLKQLLIACAKALAENNLANFDKLVEKARSAVSVSGEPIQRLGAYMVEGLVARKEESGANIYHALKCREPESSDLLSYMHILYEICPYLKFGYMAANGAIAEACKNEDCIHIIDFQIAQGTQWITLLQALAARPGGPPSVRITGIDDPISQYARGGGLEAVGKRLANISENFHIQVEFQGVPFFAPNVTLDMLDVRPGEALAVNFPLLLHHTPDESVDVRNPRDELLRTIKSLSPKVVTLVEQESNTNTTPFFYRFVEALEYYLAMFESIDVTLPRNSKQRINVEQHCLARDIVNVIACEGLERVERHELLGKWKSRLTMAGFKQFPLSSHVNSVIRRLLKLYSEHYTLEEKDDAMLLGWKERNLISASAWY